MKWNKDDATLSLEPRDLAVMAQCGMTVDEILGDHPNKNIPPLWSVLSYVMLQNRSETPTPWFHYRILCEMAQKPERCYYSHRIPKSDGTLRSLSVPYPRLRRQQQFILDTILSGLSVDSHAYAYRKGVRVEDCAKPHVGQDVLVHLDIVNFFGSVTEDMVFRTLRRETGYSLSLCRFLARLCCLRNSLPMGTVTSPALSNIVFRPCDEALTELAEAYQLNYTRYSDDIFFSGGADTDVDAVLREARRILEIHGFRLNREKTRVRRQHHRQCVLGLTVNDRIQVSRGYRRSLSQELYYLEKFGRRCKGAMEAGDYLQYMQKLQGKLAYVLHIDPGNLRLWEAHLKLRSQIDRYIFLQERGFFYQP